MCVLCVLQALCEDLFAFGVTREQQRQRVVDALRELEGAEAAEAAAKEEQKKQTAEALKVRPPDGWLLAASA